MRSFAVLLLAVFVAASTADEREVRNRLGNDDANQRSARGVNAKYTDLANEIDMENQNRVQRRFLMGNKEEDENEPKDDVEEEEHSMSMSMSL